MWPAVPFFVSLRGHDSVSLKINDMLPENQAEILIQKCCKSDLSGPFRGN